MLQERLMGDQFKKTVLGIKVFYIRIKFFGGSNSEIRIRPQKEMYNFHLLKDACLCAF